MTNKQRNKLAAVRTKKLALKVINLRAKILRIEIYLLRNEGKEKANQERALLKILNEAFTNIKTSTNHG